jgi:opacity protein-like surface antigen
VRRALALAVLMLLPCAAAQAQPAGRVELSGGIRWIGPLSFGDVAASEQTLNGGTRPLFKTRNSLEGSIGGTGAIGVRLTDSLRAEASFAYNPAKLRTEVSADAEGADPVTLLAPVSQLLFEGGLVLQPGRWRRGSLSPFVTGGAGYLRQLNDGRTLVETGQSFYAGGGLYYERVPGRPRRLKASGIRIDARAMVLRDGVAPDSDLRVAPAVVAAAFVRF